VRRCARLLARAAAAAVALATLVAALTAPAAAVVLAMLVAAPPASAAASASARPTPPHLSIRAGVLYVPATKQVLFADQIDRELAIASATKLMTALLTLEQEHRLSTVFRMPSGYYFPPADSQIGLSAGEPMSVHDLLLALLVPSADDAAVDLAYNIGHGSVGRFIGEMNARARELGLTHTHYSTPSGLDTPGNYSSALDLVKLASYLLETSPYFKRVVAMPHAVLHSGYHPRYVVNRNTLVGRVPWVNGVKTGHTNDAGYVLVGSGTQHGLTLVSAVLGTDSEASRDANTLALLEYGFSQFHLVTPLTAGQVLAHPTVKDRPGVRVPVVAGQTFTRVLPKDAVVRTRVEVPSELAAPLNKRAVVGHVIVSADGKTIARIPVLVTRRLVPVSSLAIAARFITRPITLLVVFVAVALGAGLIIRRRGHRDTRKRGIELSK
jgi:D-alanyl-D-alanine carboxypeptidase (penicillin-binding protein 5/6)